MKVGRWLGGAALAATVGLFSVSAQAAPLGSPAEGVRAAANENAITQEATWNRRGWRHRHYRGHRGWRRGYRHYYGNHYGYRGYGYRRNYGPGFSFYFGPRHHRYW